MPTHKKINISKKHKKRTSKSNKTKTMKGGDLSNETIMSMKDKEYIDLDSIRDRKGNITNKITEENSRALSSILTNNNKVKVISLRECQTTHIRKSLYNAPEFTFDDLLSDILSGLTNNTTLVKLDLSFTNITDTGLEYLSTYLTNNTTLKELYIGDAPQITEQGFNEFLRKLEERNTTLLNLDYFGAFATDNNKLLIESIMTRNLNLFKNLYMRVLGAPIEMIEKILSYIKDYKDYPYIMNM